MTIASVIATMQAKHRALDGVTTAPDLDAYPRSVSADHLPLVLTLPASGGWDSAAVDLARHDRWYSIRVYVAPVGQGGSLLEWFPTCVALMQSIGGAYMDDLDLGGTVDHIAAVQDPGGLTVTLVLGGVEYFGFECRVEVIEK